MKLPQFANFGGLLCPSLARYLSDQVGVNVLSFLERKKIGSDCIVRVAPRTSICVSEIVSSLVLHTETPCFEEYDNGSIQSKNGWERNYFVSDYFLPLVIVDNHHHVLPWRYHRSMSRIFARPLHVIHIDQHSDLGDNHSLFPHSPLPEDLWLYTYENCHVGNFINPSLENGFIQECIQIRSSYALDHCVLSHDCDYILDIDCDFWDSFDHKEMRRVRQIIHGWMQNYSFVGISIATSPYFIDQKLAVDLLTDLL